MPGERGWWSWERRGHVRRCLALAAALALLLGGCTGGTDDSSPRHDVDNAPSTAQPQSACMSYGDVLGPRPSYGPSRLSRFPGDDAMCRALWLSRGHDRLVPQGLALDGDTAWVTGYRYRPRYGARPCRLLHVDLRTGRLLSYLPRLTGSVGGRSPVYCRHGGGAALTRHGLWVLESMRLWLLDPGKVDRGEDPVLRVWRVDRPMKGSVLVEDRDRIGIAKYLFDQPTTVQWYPYESVLAAGVVDLARHGTPPRSGLLAATSTDPAPVRLQGATTDRDGGLWFAASGTRCGALERPDGTRVALGPGAEDIELDGRGHVWAAMEAGAEPFVARGRPLVPMLARFDLARLARTPDRCDL